ncbi:MAG: adenylate/guanylate cyclase domain-containing protein [Anaerolineales bacterium]|nr:adenylate/guanylate cyclase domain-containing protein [Anaerolineales bacterium]
MNQNKWHQHIIPPKRPLRWILPGLLLLGAILVQWAAPDWAGRIEALTIDGRFRLRGVEQPQQPVVIVALDEASFQILGDLEGENIRTWPRGRWAELVNKIAAYQPRIIALDVIFDTPGWDAGGDEALALAMRQAGNVILAAHMEQTRMEDFYHTSYSQPVEILKQNTAGVGFANQILDIDGAIRRAQILLNLEQQIQPSLAVVIATLYRGEMITIDQADLGKDLSLPIHFRGPEGTFTTIPMHQIWSGEVENPEVLRDAIVLLGYTTQVEQDRHAAPFAGEAGMPGVEIQANTVDTLLAGDWLHRPPIWLPLMLLAVAGLLGWGFASLPSPAAGILAFGASVIAYLMLGRALFNGQDYLLPIAGPIIVAVVMGGAVTTERAIFAERDKRLLRQRFAGVMSPERLQAVLDNWEALLNTERPEKEAAVLFADIRGFTHATEALMRQNRSPEMVRFLNAYIDTMAEAVFLEGGVVYRTFGDGLLILFGVPEPLPDHSLRAVRAAVGMALAANDLQATWPLRDEAPFQMGIGINDGPMIDAVVGRGRRFDYTVLGDPVNAASRIEGYCKEAMGIPRPAGGEVPEMVTILISDNLYQKVAPHILADESIPPFEARGKSEALRVVRVLGLKDQSPDP